MSVTIRHSFGLWAPKAESGSIEEILRQAQELSVDLPPGILGERCLYPAGHMGPEIVQCGYNYAVTSPRAIDLARLLNGDFDAPVTINYPCWGDPYALGAILSSDADVRKSVERGMRHAIEVAQGFEARVIWCLGNDEIRADETFSFADALKAFADMWGPIVSDTNQRIAIEFQAYNLGVLGYLPTVQRAIDWCQQFNAEFSGWNPMYLVLHCAQAQAVGTPVSTVLAQIMDAGLFDGLIHLNVGEIGSTKVPRQIEEAIAQALDPRDILFGKVEDRTWAQTTNADIRADQQTVMDLLAQWLKDQHASKKNATLDLQHCFRASTLNWREELWEAVICANAMLRKSLTSSGTDMNALLS